MPCSKKTANLSLSRPITRLSMASFGSPERGVPCYGATTPHRAVAQAMAALPSQARPRVRQANGPLQRIPRGRTPFVSAADSTPPVLSGRRHPLPARPPDRPARRQSPCPPGAAPRSGTLPARAQHGQHFFGGMEAYLNTVCRQCTVCEGPQRQSASSTCRPAAR